MLHKAIPDREHLAQAKVLEADGETEEGMEQETSKGGPIYDSRLVTTWRKRKAVVMKRLKDKKNPPGSQRVMHSL